MLETHPIEELQHVINPPDEPAVVEASCFTLVKPRIGAVFIFKCLRCRSHTEPAEVRCCNCDCGVLNNSTFCEKFSSANILVIKGRQNILLTAFGEMISELLGDNSLSPTEEALLRYPPILELKHQNNEIMNGAPV